MSSVKNDDGVMIVKFKSSCPDIVTCDMAYWYIVIECTQVEADSLTVIEIYKNNDIIEVK